MATVEKLTTTLWTCSPAVQARRKSCCSAYHHWLNKGRASCCNEARPVNSAKAKRQNLNVLVNWSTSCNWSKRVLIGPETRQTVLRTNQLP